MVGVVLIVFLSGPSLTVNAVSAPHTWQVRVGEELPISVGADKIDTTLFQGDFRLETVLDASGNLSSKSVCVGFPEVEATRNIDDNDRYNLELRLDMDNCQIVVDDVKRTVVSDTMGKSHTMARSASEAHEEHWGRAIVKAAELEAIGFAFGFALTQSKVMLDYASSLNVYGSSHICEVQSPAFFAGIVWHNDNDGCLESPITDHGTYLKIKTTGDFYATQSYADAWDESIHSSSAEIKGYSTQYIITCEWWPNSIEDLELAGLGVSLECEANERSLF